jgi:hypothetical protein
MLLRILTGWRMAGRTERLPFSARARTAAKLDAVFKSYRFLLFLLEVRIRLLDLRMSLLKTRKICLQCGYFAADEVNLASRFRYLSAAINHPVECINVFLNFRHKNGLPLPPNNY